MEAKDWRRAHRRRGIADGELRVSGSVAEGRSGNPRSSSGERRRELGVGEQRLAAEFHAGGLGRGGGGAAALLGAEGVDGGV